MPGKRPPDGIGFVLAVEDCLVGVDLDCCRDRDTGLVEDWALDIVRRLGTYAEVSPSGTGVKLVARGCLPTAGGRRENIELYAHSRFFTLTGDRLPEAPCTIIDCQDELGRLYRKVKGGAAVPAQPCGVAFRGAMSNDEVAVLISQGSTGVRFARLWSGDISQYNSTSEADMALCGAIARLVGPDPARVEAIFDLSMLASRKKWSSREDYRERTAMKAVEGLAFQSTSGSFQSTSNRSIQVHSGDTQGRAARLTTNEGFPAEHSDAVRAAEALALEQEKGMPDWRAIFDLTRRLKAFAAHPFPLEAAVKAYCTKTDRSFDEVWLTVQAKWEMVKTPEGAGDWDWACRMARTNRMSFTPERGEKYELAASLAYYLSLLNGQFALGVEKLGVFLGVSARTGTDVIRLLLKDKLIEVVVEADRKAKRTREFRLGAAAESPSSTPQLGAPPPSPVEQHESAATSS